MFSFIFKYLILPILIFLAIPLIMLGLMYRSEAAPLADYKLELDFNDEVMTTLDTELAALVSDDTKESVRIGINDSLVNRFIASSLQEQNEKFLNEAFEGERDYRYMMVIEERVGVRGIWIQFTEDNLRFNIGIDVFVTESMTYKTMARVDFEIKLDANDEYTFAVKRVRLGNLPLPLKIAVSIADFAAKQAANIDIDALITERLPLGTFTFNQLRYTVTYDDIILMAKDNDPMLGSLVDLFLHSGLFGFKVDQNELYAEVRLGKLRSDGSISVPDYLSPASMAGFDQNQAMQNQISQFLISALSGERKLRLDDELINKLVYANLGETLMFSQDITFDLGEETRSYAFAMQGVFIDFVGDELKAYMVLDIAGLEAVVELNATVMTHESGDIIMTVQRIKIGEIEIGDETIGSVLSLLGDNLNITGASIIVPKETIQSLLIGNDIGLSNVAIVNSRLELTLDVSGTIDDALTNLIEEVHTAINTILNDGSLDPIFDDYPQLETLLNDFVDGFLTGDLDASDVEALYDLISQMDPADQTLLFETIVGALDQQALEDMFGAFGGN